jgi:hypothetical protein
MEADLLFLPTCRGKSRQAGVFRGFGVSIRFGQQSIHALTRLAPSQETTFLRGFQKEDLCTG